MINKYKEFLQDKGKNNFWKKAKQKEYNGDVINKIYKELTVDFDKLTTRNSITLRYLGFIINLGADKLKLSNAGETFLNSPYKQKILDEQIMKIYLDCPQLNDNLSIKIIPMDVLLKVLYHVDYFTFDEYQLFICWVNAEKEIELVIELIKEFRNSKETEKYLEVLNKKSDELGIKDFSDNVKRFFDMILISSYINNDGNEMKSILSKKDIEIIVESFSVRDFDNENYFNYLTSNDGWQIYTKNPSYIKVIESLEQKTTQEQEEIINQITGALELPDISKILPKAIEMEIDNSAIFEKKERVKSASPRKIDFELRDSNNRMFGDFAEKIVIKYEINELSKIFPDRLSEIKQLSLVDDSLGYDIVSINNDGSEKHIEVKAVKNKPSLSFKFYISENEINIARYDKNYNLYIVFDYLSESPFIYKMPNPFVNEIPGVKVDPVKYLVTVIIKK